RTHDFGRSWTKIVNGIGPADYAHVVREDPARKGLLYAGTQHGFYVSLDDGDHWQPLRNGLSDTQVADIWVEANEIAIATHGRGGGGPPTAPIALGLQRFNWDLQYQPVVTFPGMVLWGATTNGPTALPGTFQARLTVDGKTQTQSFVVKKHPWHNVTDADMRTQFELASEIRDK